jgi:hypothetical protein
MERRLISRCVAGAFAGVLALPIVGVTSAGADGPEIGEAISGSALTELRGKDRYETAGLAATTAFGRAETVVLASGTSFPDALAASSLAGDLEAPILLLDGDSVPEGTATAYAALEPSKVVVVGGAQRISDAAVARLTGETAQVSRVAGTDRWQTAARVAGQFEAGEVDGERTAFLAVGGQFADAVAAGPAAYAGSLPVLLTEPGALPAATSAALTDEGIEHVVVLGGENAVNSATVAQVEALGITTERLQGPDRYATATAIADWSIARGFLDDAEVSVVRGDDSGGGADALAAAPLAAVRRTPVLLLQTPDNPSTASAWWMLNHFPRVQTMVVVGAWPQQAVAVMRKGPLTNDRCGDDGCQVRQSPTQLADGTLDVSSRVVDLDGATQVEIGAENLLARTTDGAVWGWGRISDEADGVPWTDTPVQIAGISGATDIAVSPGVGVALDGAGRVWQFGWTVAGGKATATTAQEVALPARAVDISAEKDHGVAVLRDGSVWTFSKTGAVQRVPELTDAYQISSSYYQTSVLRVDGTVWSFGWDFTTEPSSALTPDRRAHALGWSGVSQVEGSDFSTYAARYDGRLAAWGWNSLAELGAGYQTPVGADGRTEPQFLPEARTGVQGLTAGGSHVVAFLTEGGSFAAWGANFRGEVDPGNLSTVVVHPVAFGAGGIIVAGDGTNVQLVTDF